MNTGEKLFTYFKLRFNIEAEVKQKLTEANTFEK